MTTGFNFDEQREQSSIKTEIVVEYFDAWTKIMEKRSSKLAYVDLYAGPGVYEDGSKSTPILILEKILSSEVLRKSTVVYLNEKDCDNFKKLTDNVLGLKGIQSLAYAPAITNREIDYNAPEWLQLPDMPMFCFLDPSGYYGLSQNLFRKIEGRYGSDIIFFFNFNEINRAVSNDKVLFHMQELFGETRFAQFSSLIEKNFGTNREEIIVNEMKEALKEVGFNRVLPFKFKAERKKRTSHYVFFATRNENAFKIMKDIMWKIGEKDVHGVGTYGFIPSSDKENGIQLSIIDLLEDPYEQFGRYLCKQYAGKTFTAQKLYNIDTLNTPFVVRQYKEVLKELERNDMIKCEPPYQRRRKNTLADTTLITFLPQ